MDVKNLLKNFQLPEDFVLNHAKQFKEQISSSFLTTEIPPKKSANLLKESNIESLSGTRLGKMILLVDSTFWGSAKNGIAFCENGVFWHDTSGSCGAVLYAHITVISGGNKTSTITYNGNTATISYDRNSGVFKLLWEILKSWNRMRADSLYGKNDGDITDAIPAIISLLQCCKDCDYLNHIAGQLMNIAETQNTAFANAVKLYQASMDFGNEIAKNTLGKFHYRGRFGTVNYEKAFELLNGSSDPEAIMLLGHMYCNGNGVKQDVFTAIAKYHDCLQTNYQKEAQECLNQIRNNAKSLFEKGQRECNGAQKLSLYQEAFMAGYLPALAEAGHITFASQDSSVREKAFSFYSQCINLIEDKEKCSLYSLIQPLEKIEIVFTNCAYLWYHGIGTSVDYDKALKYYHKAEAMGVPGLEHVIAELYAQKHDNENAIRYYRKAADNGNVEDARLAANLLCNIPEEWETALTYFKKVIDSSQADGDSYLKAGKILEQHPELSADASATAMIYYKSAWEKGIPAGARGMGRLCAKPDFQGFSRVEALNCFTQVLEQEPEATILDARECLQIDKSFTDEYIKDWLSFFEKGIHLQQPAAALTIASFYSKPRSSHFNLNTARTYCISGLKLCSKDSGIKEQLQKLLNEIDLQLMKSDATGNMAFELAERLRNNTLTIDFDGPIFDCYVFAARAGHAQAKNTALELIQHAEDEAYAQVDQYEDSLFAKNHPFKYLTGQGQGTHKGKAAFFAAGSVLKWTGTAAAIAGTGILAAIDEQSGSSFSEAPKNWLYNRYKESRDKKQTKQQEEQNQVESLREDIKEYHKTLRKALEPKRGKKIKS